MDWNLFWNAFGAIGTTIGSFITAGAVIIAVMQYRQPFVKKIKIDFSVVMADFYGEPNTYYKISFMNCGIRKCKITSMHIKGKERNLFILSPQRLPNYNNPQFPVELEQEQCCDMFFGYDDFRSVLKGQYEQGWIPKYKHLRIYVQDSAGKTYCGKFRMKMSGFKE